MLLYSVTEENPLPTVPLSEDGAVCYRGFPQLIQHRAVWRIMVRTRLVACMGGCLFKSFDTVKERVIH